LVTTLRPHKNRRVVAVPVGKKLYKKKRRGGGRGVEGKDE